jgi:hypothetical protein
MTTLKEVLLSEPSHRSKLIRECVQLVDSEVANKRGISGFAVKAGFKVVKSIKPGFIEQVVDMLFDDFMGEVEPFYGTWVESKPGRFSEALVKERVAVASALLNVTDRRAQRAQTRSVKKAYQKLRPKAAAHVQEAIPGMGRILDQYVS